MDRIRKSVGEQMTLFIVISGVSSLALACFDGFLAGLILIANIRKNHIVRHNGFLMKNIYCDMHNKDQLLTAPVGEKKKHVCK
jgi:hypothetical protein